MNYAKKILPSCQGEIYKACRKNPVLQKILDRKINEIVVNPYHYKSLKHDFAGERRVHIMKSFVLKFKIDENNKSVIFIFFGHHDEAYKR